jgi:hypothetical protein
MNHHPKWGCACEICADARKAFYQSVRTIAPVVLASSLTTAVVCGLWHSPAACWLAGPATLIVCAIVSPKSK